MEEVILNNRRNYIQFTAKIFAMSAIHSRFVITRLSTQLQAIYRVAQKSKPLPNYQKIVLNRIKTCQ